MQGSQILVVGDDTDVNLFISQYLMKDGFQVTLLEDGKDVSIFVKENKPDLIILDTIVPGIDGFELCRVLRKFTGIPIIFVSSQKDDLDIILGLEVGGDDYITKPFSINQLVARVKANLRRNKLSHLFFEEEKLVFTGLEINTASQFVLLNGKEISLSTKEFEILVTMARHPYRVFKINELYQCIWDTNSYGDTRTLIVHISNLRGKLESDRNSPKYILTIRGKGYKFNDTLKAL